MKTQHRTREPGAGAWRVAPALALLLTGAPGGTQDARAQDAAGPGAASQAVDQTRSRLEKWVETRRIIAQEKQQLTLAREMLAERIAMVRREVQGLRERIDEARANIAKTDAQRDELTAENDRLKGASASLAEAVAGLEARVKALLGRSPAPLRERVRPLSQQLPGDPAQTELSLSTRYQNVMGILNEVNKFHSEVTVTSEVRELPGGASAQVAAIYLGLGAGYYVSGNNQHAGVGVGGASGWVWTPDNAIAPRVDEAIAIVEGEQVASFVPLPVGPVETAAPLPDAPPVSPAAPAEASAAAPPSAPSAE